MLWSVPKRRWKGLEGMPKLNQRHTLPNGGVPQRRRSRLLLRFSIETSTPGGNPLADRSEKTPRRGVTHRASRESTSSGRPKPLGPRPGALHPSPSEHRPAEGQRKSHEQNNHPCARATATDRAKRGFLRSVQAFQGSLLRVKNMLE